MLRIKAKEDEEKEKNAPQTPQMSAQEYEEFKRFQEIMAIPVEAEASHPVGVDKLEGNISFENVTFHYTSGDDDEDEPEPTATAAPAPVEDTDEEIVDGGSEDPSIAGDEAA